MTDDAVNQLDAGQVVTETFTVTTTDGSTAVVTVNITGTEDVSALTSAIESLVESDVVLSTNGTLVVTDLDTTDATVVAQLNTAGSYGRFSINASGAWTYTTDDAVNELNAGQAVQEVFTVATSDGGSATVTINITGTEDVSTLTSETKNLTESDAVLNTGGSLVLTDLDGTDATVVAQTNAIGTYGKFTIDAAGVWTYVTDDAVNQLDAGQVVTETFNVITTDGGSATVTVNITGTEDIATLTDDSAALTESNVVLNANGSLTLSDLDLTDATVVAQVNTAGTYGQFNIDDQGVWTYATNDAVNQLNAGQVVTETFVVATSDGGSATVTVTITGSEDIATLTSETKNLTEGDAVLSTGGHLALVDLDATNATVVPHANTAGTYGTFNIDDQGIWTYVTNDAVNELDANQLVTETFSVVTTDGGTATVTVNITGTNDIATLTSETQNLVESDAILSTTGSLTVTDLDTTDATVVAQTNAAGTYGKFTIDAAGVWTYVTDDAVNQLDAGQVVTETFTVTTTDGSTAVVTVNITGTEDVSTLTSAIESLVESDVVLSTNGTLVVTDLDTTDATVVAQLNTAGSYGRFSINASGAWTYTTDDAVNELNAGQAVQEVFTVATSDGGSATVTINITGTEDVSTLTSETKNLTESDAVLNTGGSLVLTDLDGTDATVVAQTNAIGTYGKFTIDAAGVWTYVTDDAVNQLDAGQVVTETFNVITTDGGSATVTVNITGTNDAAVVTSATVALDEADAPVSTSGTLTSTDVDNADNAFTASTKTGTYGDFAIDANGAWTFTANDAFNELNVGDSHTETFNVTSVDGTPSTVQITINGTNDAATVSSASVALVETDAPVSTSGVLTSNDVDNSNNAFTASTTVGVRGTFDIDANGAWTFTANAAFDELNVGDSYAETFNVESVDGTASTVQITINGTNDAATVSSAAVVLTETDLAADVSTSGTLTSSDVDNDDNAFIASNTVGTYGTFAIDASGAWTFTANAAFDELNVGDSHSETFNVTSVDGTPSSVQITINGTNDAATVSTATISLIETDAPLSTNGTLTSSDVDNTDNLFTVSTTVGTYGSFEINEAGAWTYLANSAFNELNVGESHTETFNVTSVDGTASTVQITINGTNDLPVIAASSEISGTVIESGHTDDGTVVPGTNEVTGQLTATDIDNGATQAWTITAQTDTHGSFSLTNAATGAWKYELNNTTADSLKEGETVTETYTVQVTDDQGGTASQVVTVTVNGTNDAPEITSADVAIDGTVAESGVVGGVTPSVTGTIVASDVDDDAEQTWTINADNSVVTYGDFTINSDTGAWEYTLDNSLAATQALNAGDTVSQTYIVRVTDDFGAYDDQEVVINITGTNDAPTITSTIEAAKGTVVESGDEDDGTDVVGIITVNGQLTADDVDGSDTPATLDWTPVNTTNNYGTFTLTDTGAWNYALNNASAEVQALKEGDTHEETFAVTVSDGNGGTATQNVTVNITGTNDSPVIDLSHVDSVIAGSVAERGHDASGNLVIGTSTANGKLISTDVDANHTATWSVRNDASITTYGEFAISPANGTWTYTLNNNLAATQALDEGDTVIQTYTVRVTDDFGAYADQEVTITITGTNDKPSVVEAISAQSGFDADVVDFNAGVYFEDLDTGDTLTFTANGLPAGLTINNATGEITGTIDSSASQYGGSGVHTVVITASDGTASTNQTFTWTVLNPAPVADDDTFAVSEDDAGAQASVVNLLTNDTDPDGDTLTVSAVNGVSANTGIAVTGDGSGVGNGEFIINSDGSYSFDPKGEFEYLAFGETETSTIEYTISDGEGGFDTATLTVTVNGQNDSPVANDDLSITDRNTAKTIDVRGNDTDVDATDLLRVTHIDGQPIATGGSVVLAGQGTVTLNANGTLTFEPDNGFVGQVQIPYTLSDDNNLANSTDTATWTVNVIGVDIVDDASLADANVGENVLSTLDDLDNVTINGQVPVGGTLEGLVITSSAGGASVTLTPAQIAGITINGNGSFTATVDLFDGGLPILADGTLTVIMTANDGTNPSLSSTDTILQDTVTTVTADSLTINDDDDTASLSGTGEVGASIAITVDGAAVPITTVVVDGNGDWSYDFGNDLSDNESITVVATDIYGNTANDGRDVPKLIIADINGGVDGHITLLEAGLDVVGSDAAANSESASGTFTITLNDALDEVQVAGTTISAAALNAATPGAPVVVNAPNGIMTIRDYNTGTGVVSYSYELTGPVTHDNAAGNNSFDEALEIRVSDVEGDVRIGTLHVNIVDDIPTVGENEAEVVLAEGGVTVGSATVGGENLLTNDTQGADGARVHTVTYNDINGDPITTAAIVDGGNTGVLTTQYGSLTVHSDGSWSYTSASTSTTTTSVDHSGNGTDVQDNFSYNVIDADGDISVTSATQEIEVTDTGPVIGAPVASGVDEANLPTGSDPTPLDLTVSGSLAVTKAADSIDTTFTAATKTALEGQLLKSGGVDVEYVLSDAHTLIAYSGAGRTEADKVFTVEINNPTASTASYNFTLQGTLDHAAAAVDLDFGFTVTDSDGDSDTDTFTVTVTDDVPTAVAQTAVNVSEGTETVSSASGGVNLITGGTADAQGADGAEVHQIEYVDDLDVITVVTLNGATTGVLDTKYGQLTVNPDGTWSYTSDAVIDHTGGVAESDQFRYNLIDGDGDISNWAAQPLNVTDTTPIDRKSVV